MYDTVAAVLAANLGALAVAVALVQFLSQKLKELVGVLLLGSHQVFKGLILGDPEARQDVSRRVAIGHVSSPEILEHVVHGAAQAILHFAVAARMAITKVEIPENGVVEEALKDDILVAGGPCVVNTT